MRDDEWLRVHARLRDRRYELGVAAARRYPGVDRVAGTPLLTTAGWTTAGPVPLDAVALELDRSPVTFPRVPGPRHSDAVARLAAPAVFENRPTYRLLDAVLDGDRPRMRFGTGSYFDGIDTGGAVAHEFAAAGPGTALPLRDAIGDPVDPLRRPTNVAISAVTLRHDRTTGDVRFLAHHRDPAAVAHAGGLVQVVPVGVFQPVTDDPEPDVDLWRCLQREFAEELLGAEEPSGPVDHDAWPFEAERRAGRMRPYLLGMGVDPLTLATDVLCAVVVDAGTFDRVFADLVSHNAEGEVSDHPFTADVVDRFVHRERMQAAGAAVLALAWKHRARLLS